MALSSAQSAVKSQIGGVLTSINALIAEATTAKSQATAHTAPHAIAAMTNVLAALASVKDEVTNLFNGMEDMDSAS